MVSGSISKVAAWGRGSRGVATLPFEARRGEPLGESGVRSSPLGATRAEPPLYWQFGSFPVRFTPRQ